MLTTYGELVCYKQTPIDSHGKLKFFLEKHSTKEGTWGYLSLEEGEIDFIFLNGFGQELSRTRLNKTNPQLLIPPAAWHKIIPISENFKALLEFYCKPNRFFYKKYGLGAVHSDLQYIYHNYLQNHQLTVLDVGCGSGRNLLYFASVGHSITGIDNNELALKSISEIAIKENLTHVQTITHDLNQPLNLQKEHYNFVFSTVSLQFLKVERISSLLNELQHATKTQGYHFLVYPIKSNLYTLPATFTFLPEKEELYHWYQNSGWSIIEYKESTGLLHKLDEFGRPLQGLFGHLLAQKNL
ncbi:MULTISPECIES: SAM-dependent methyltransferase TehB [Legionella]|uniref:Tellurite resistance protein TehB n=1 Tax=Legionella drozanskii LLAP-1 TaxID=1212489 RepID=A0A0W0SXX1_9GAMM|nr:MULTISPECIES: SAM-dependent methyltransferase TehB [Legionella]KTC88210.1 tellurite resistance protein TehB [Legionella drozanskii LLAP-1]PJE06981.1 MAG: SAM-dependent methyltransferase TehB [Legionella sp.]